MPGTLYLIPNTLGPTEAAPGALSNLIPTQVQALTSRGAWLAERRPRKSMCMA